MDKLKDLLIKYSKMSEIELDWFDNLLETYEDELSCKWISREDDEIDIYEVYLYNENYIIRVCNDSYNKFDGLLSLKDASILFGKDESTLRRNISNGKFDIGKDCKKFGKQWVFDIKALEREYNK